jgi:biotin/methionine sulfoxide reductase
MGNEHDFTQGRSADDWIAHIWAQTRNAGAAMGLDLPAWDDFISGGIVDLPDPSPDQVFLADFRADPMANPLPTPSGKIEIFSKQIATMALPDCGGHATWFPPREAARRGERLSLLSGQPRTRLHSQLDNGNYSLSHKVKGREPVLINPEDAAARSIKDGDIVELFNERGRCLAGARVTPDIRKGCVFLWTGAWWDPDFDAPGLRCRHGNPNALTHDLRSSTLSQSPAAHSTQVELRRFDGTPQQVQAHNPPNFVTPKT